MIRITAPHFVAGAETADGRVVRAAPILRWMVGKDLPSVVRYCRRKRWWVEFLS